MTEADNEMTTESRRKPSRRMRAIARRLGKKLPSQAEVDAVQDARDDKPVEVFTPPSPTWKMLN